MIFSKSCVYGIRALIYLAGHHQGQFVPIKDISKNLGISFHFLTKILQILSENDLIASFKGPKGGVKLTLVPDSISLMHIILALDGSEIFDGCMLGLPDCSTQTPCPLHDEWTKQRDEMKIKFESITLRKLADQVQEKGLRLYDINEIENAD